MESTPRHRPPWPPASNPTTPFWHSIPHAYANNQSPWPTEPVDIVVIGSGISGMSLCRTLRSKRPDLKITLVEARSLCSGATGRNGGHIKTMTFAMWHERKHQFGIDEAIKVSEFEHSHLDAIADALRYSRPRQCHLLHPRRKRFLAPGHSPGLLHLVSIRRQDYDYLISRQDGGVVVGRAGTGRQATADDTTTDLPAQAHLRGFFHEAAAGPKPGAADHIDYSWSGIVGFTQD